jgi:hypothetical protein
VRGILNAAFEELGVLSAASSFARSPMIVTGVAMELSVAEATWWRDKALGDAPVQTAYAHLDESTIQLKSIVYLSDVGPDNGPTSTYPGVYDSLQLHPLQELVGRVIANVGSRSDSPLRRYYGRAEIGSMSAASFRAGSRADRVRSHFMRLPPALRFNSHLGWDVLPGSELESALVSAERAMRGPPGTFLVFDGAHLLHRGGMVREKSRVAFQVVLSDPRKRRARWPEMSRDATSLVDAGTET